MKALYCILILCLAHGPAHAQSEEYTETGVTNEFDSGMDENEIFVLDSDKQKVDLGKAKVGDRKEKAVTIKNKTNSILYPSITSIDGDNGFSVQIYTLGIPPGGSTSVKLSYTGISTEPFGDHKAKVVIALKDKAAYSKPYAFDVKAKLVKP